MHVLHSKRHVWFNSALVKAKLFFAIVGVDVLVRLRDRLVGNDRCAAAGGPVHAVGLVASAEPRVFNVQVACSLVHFRKVAWASGLTAFPRSVVHRKV